MLWTLNERVREMLFVMTISTDHLALTKLILQAFTVSPVNQQVRDIALFFAGMMKIQTSQVPAIPAIEALPSQHEYCPSLYRTSGFNASDANTLLTSPCNRLSAVVLGFDLKRCGRQRSRASHTLKQRCQINTFPGVWALSWMPERKTLQTTSSPCKRTAFAVNRNAGRNALLTSCARARLLGPQPQRFARQTISTRRVHTSNVAINKHVPRDRALAGTAWIRHPTNVTPAYDTQKKEVSSLRLVR